MYLLLFDTIRSAFAQGECAWTRLYRGLSRIYLPRGLGDNLPRGYLKEKITPIVNKQEDWYELCFPILSEDDLSRLSSKLVNLCLKPKEDEETSQ